MPSSMPSEAPPKRKSNGIRISASWRTIVIAVLSLLGGGSVLGWTLVPASSGVSETKLHEVGPAHTDLTATLKNHGEKIDGNTGAINSIAIQLDNVQDTQQHAYARQEARRVTADLKLRAKREFEYDRIFRLNFARLSDGQEPCANLDCSN